MKIYLITISYLLYISENVLRLLKLIKTLAERGAKDISVIESQLCIIFPSGIFTMVRAFENDTSWRYGLTHFRPVNHFTKTIYHLPLNLFIKTLPLLPDFPKWPYWVLRNQQHFGQNYMSSELHNYIIPTYINTCIYIIYIRTYMVRSIYD